MSLDIYSGNDFSIERVGDEWALWRYCDDEGGIERLILSTSGMDELSEFFSDWYAPKGHPLRRHLHWMMLAVGTALAAAGVALSLGHAHAAKTPAGMAVLLLGLAGSVLMGWSLLLWSHRTDGR